MSIKSVKQIGEKKIHESCQHKRFLVWGGGREIKEEMSLSHLAITLCFKLHHSSNHARIVGITYKEKKIDETMKCDRKTMKRIHDNERITTYICAQFGGDTCNNIRAAP